MRPGPADETSACFVYQRHTALSENVEKPFVKQRQKRYNFNSGRVRQNRFGKVGFGSLLLPFWGACPTPRNQGRIKGNSRGNLLERLLICVSGTSPKA